MQMESLLDPGISVREKFIMLWYVTVVTNLSNFARFCSMNLDVGLNLNFKSFRHSN